MYVCNPITKCKYSSILLACPSGPTIQIVSMQKTKHLELSDSYWILGGLQILHEHKFFWTWSFYFPDILQTHYQNGSSTCLWAMWKILTVNNEKTYKYYIPYACHYKQQLVFFFSPIFSLAAAYIANNLCTKNGNYSFLKLKICGL